MISQYKTNTMINKGSPWVIKETEHWSVGYFYTINSIIGTGVLATPWAYEQMGWLLGGICQVLIAVFWYIVTCQLIETMSRIESLKQMEDAGYTITPLTLRDIISPREPSHYIHPPLEDTESLVENPQQFTPDINARRHDLLDISRMLYGKYGALLYFLLIILSACPLLAGYTSIFASSLAATIPLVGDTCNIYDESGFDEACRYSYIIYALIFLLLMSYLVIRGLTEQFFLQITTAIIRFVVCFLMIFTAIAAFAGNNYVDSTDSNDSIDFVLFDLGNIGLGLPIIITALSFQNSFPNTIQFIKDKKQTLQKLVFLSIVSCAVLFFLMGLLIPPAVKDIEELITLNWEDYSNGEEDTKWWMHLISYTVILLPVIDMISIFPIVSIAISDNIQSWKNPNYCRDVTSQSEYVFFRLAISVPAVIVAFFVYDLSIILEITGVIFILGIGVGSPLLHMASKILVPEKSEFDTVFTDRKWAFVVMCSSLVLFFVLAVTGLIERLS